MVRSSTPGLGRRMLHATALVGVAFVILAPTPTNAATDPVTVKYTFDRPTLSQVTVESTVYDRLAMPDCPNGGMPGEPALPARGARILIPYGQQVSSIEIVPGERVTLGDGFLVEPVSRPVPLSAGPDAIEPPAPDPAIYGLDTAFPASTFQDVGTQRFRGYSILIVKLRPVQYTPTSGELAYFADLTVVVHTVDADASGSLLRGLAHDTLELQARVDNPAVADTYLAAGLRGERSYELLILTTDALAGAFGPLKDYHDANGTPTQIHTTSDVGSSSPPAIRDYIRDRFELDGIDYVIIGADDDIIPAQNLYVDGTSDMPGDIFYACLDGSWNFDGDSYYGEITDGEGGGDVDLVAEVYVGRASVGDTTEATRFVDKTIWYLTNQHMHSEKVLMVGEYLGFGTVSDYAMPTLLELIDGSDTHGYTTVGIPSTLYDVDGLYDAVWPTHDWPRSELVTRLNNSVHIVNHLGHGSPDYAMKMYNSHVLSELNNTDLFFVYSQTCSAGHFDGTDCWAETATIKTDYGAFAVIMNARYGYGAWDSTDGPSQRFNRELWDAVYDEGTPELGRANQDSKEDNIYRIDESCMRWCTYELNLFGDPTVVVKGIDGYRLNPDPGSQDLCCPPTDEAVYAIDVELLGDFDETVALSVSGVPDGAIVDFTVDSGIPPFATVMTVSNLIGAAPDSYGIIINGASATIDLSTVVYLNLSDDAPDSVMLSGPADGETDVPLLPEFSWEPASQAREYELEIASDPGFTSVVYSATTAGTAHTPDTALGTRTRYYWRVRGINTCGQGDFSDPFDFITVNMIRPRAYDMLNGQTGMYTYFDDLYDGDGDPTQALSPLSNGLGELVDGVIATQNWNVDYHPYVGWNTVDPTITFHFDGVVPIRRITIYVDDSNGSGGVYPPEDVTLVMGGETLVFTVPDPPGGEPFGFTMDDLDLEGDTLELTIADHSSSSGYMMLSEVEIFGGACQGDLTGDGQIDLADLAILLAHYPTDVGAQPDDGDLDGDGDIDLADLAILLAVYGTDCP